MRQKLTKLERHAFYVVALRTIQEPDFWGGFCKALRGKWSHTVSLSDFPEVYKHMPKSCYRGKKAAVQYSFWWRPIDPLSIKHRTHNYTKRVAILEQAIEETRKKPKQI